MAVEEHHSTGEGGRLIVKLLIGIAVGIAVGLACVAMGRGSGVMQVVGSIQYFTGQIIFFVVPLVVLAFIGPAIIRLGANASRMLFTGVGLAYLSSVGAALFAYAAGSVLIRYLHIVSDVPDPERAMPDLLFKFAIPPLMGVITALVTALAFGLAIIWAKAEILERAWYEFERCVLFLVGHIVIPLLPFFIASTFSVLAYEGLITEQFPTFLSLILFAILGHFLWMTLLYALAGGISGKNPWQVARYYGPAYLTAVGTMSSAATLPVSLACARRSPILSRETVDFMVPLGATVHLCGSVLTETLFILAISQILYGGLPDPGTMILFITLFGFFAVGAPGVPGGTVMASLGIVVSVLGFDERGTALLIAIFALQDSFGTACNVTADGALALMIEGIFGKRRERSAPGGDAA
ncbi:MAG: dicarboxylate/amino acid:cation symporter [Planctomycetes bacterium]|nr:dicarboxylate/amino acid:cation symporter [Planctomycetota bacterium]